MDTMTNGQWKVYDSVSNLFVDSYFFNYDDAAGWVRSQFGSDQTQFTIVWIPSI